ncbi:hypothetical protein FCM35_KLT09045 [Carex littledalei]|uniref:CBM20 domain-containing protein n=1 Tax=Carex littledalei TaxID=544730 RepID=A0A833VH36_9POAL|nr:hypothetical protein FCM35_KLT09045 [Carex littledalei]
MPLKDEPSVSQAAGVPSYPFSLRLMSLRNGDTAVACEELCKVIWSLEIELTNGRVYLTGEPDVLGCWNPDLAIPLSPSLQMANLWETEIMVPCGIHIKYNYLMMKKTSSWPVSSYRPGPKFSLSIPPSCKGNEPVSVRDCWVRDVGHRNPTPSWDSWLFHPSLSHDPFEPVNGSLNQASFSGQNSVLKSQNGIPLIQKPPSNLSKYIKERRTEANFSPRNQPNENPSSQSTEDKASYINEYSNLKDQLVKKPWLLLQTKDFQIEEFNPVKDPLVSSMATVPENSSRKKITTKFLINSSACNMRRIAVLENDTLVELILEPLNNSVMFNNIYLGVVKKMMPQKGGVLVDIGLTEPVFMFMRENRGLFVYPKNNAVTESKNSECREDVNKWVGVSKGVKIIVQVIKPKEEGTGSSTNSVMLTPYPIVKSRFWILMTHNEMIDVPLAVEEPERARLLAIAKALKPAGFGLKAEPAAAGHPSEELEKDLDILLSTWDGIVEHAKSAVQAEQEKIVGAVPAMLHRAMNQNLTVIYDYFPDNVESVLVDSPRSYHEVTIDLQKIAPELCDRVELYKKRTPIFDEYKIEEEIERILRNRVPLPDGGHLVIEQTEAFVSIDVNSGRSMLGQRLSQEKAIKKVNLAAAKQIARELRLRNIGGVIIVDFIDMANDQNKISVYEEMKKEVERDRSKVAISKISSLGLMEITREMVHHSDSFVISKPCEFCQATGRVEALATTFSKIEHEISRFLASSNEKPDPRKPKSWPSFLLTVEQHMYVYMTKKTKLEKTKLAILESSLNVSVSLKAASGFPWGKFELIPPRCEKNSNA